jgi:hypothetical protein
MSIENLINEYNKTKERQSKYHVNAMWFTNYGYKLRRLFNELHDLTTVELVEQESSDKQDSFAHSYKYRIADKYEMYITTSRNEKTKFYGKIETI